MKYRNGLLLFLFLVQAPNAIAENIIGKGAVLDHRPMGTAELMLLCSGAAPIEADKATQKIACLHYVQGFLDGHDIAMGSFMSIANLDHSIVLPKQILTCVDFDKVSLSKFLGLFAKRYGTLDAMAQTPSAYAALTKVIMEAYPCKS